ncbi:MAG: hypothetical protein CMO81_07495 [Waddliaceae bacterium]|nr:hypothetical protein [Waddliaceae bacterium]
MRLFACLFLLITMSSCHGYHWGHGGSTMYHNTISIPYVEGDDAGYLTAELVRAAGISGPLRYKEESADLILKTKIVDYSNRSIGYRYEMEKNGSLGTKTVPNEGRLTIVLEVEVLDGVTGAPVLEKALLNAELDFDYEYEYRLGSSTITQDSLGQINEFKTADMEARRPAYRRLAQRVLDYINNATIPNMEPVNEELERRSNRVI